MTIFVHYLKRVLRNKILLGLLFALPFITISQFLIEVTSPDRIRVGVVDEDRTALTAAFVRHMRGEFDTQPIARAEMRPALLDGKFDYVFLFRRGYTQALIRGERVAPESFRIKEPFYYAYVRQRAEAFLDAAQSITLVSDGDGQIFYGRLRTYQTELLRTEYHHYNVNKPARSYLIVGMLVMFMLSSGVFAGTIILGDKDQKTFHRTLSAPVPVWSHTLQASLAFLSVCLFQMAAVLLILAYGFHVYLGNSLWSLMALLAVYTFVCVALGVTLSTFARTQLQGMIITVLCLPMLTMLGGVWFPLKNASEALKKLALFNPVAWATQGVDKLLSGSGLASLGREIGILCLFALFFFLFGAWRKADVAK